MKKSVLLVLCLVGCMGLRAQESATEFSAEEAAAVASILAKENQAAAQKVISSEENKAQTAAQPAPTTPAPDNSASKALTETSAQPTQAEPASQAAAQTSAQSAPEAAGADAEKIILPEETKNQALAETNVQTPQAAAQAQEPENQEPDEEELTPAGKKQKCLLVAFIDIDEAFNAHPRTIAVKEQIRDKILSKEDEVQKAKALIEQLRAENSQLARQLKEIKPFYERIVIEPHPLLPKIEESADSVELGNVLNHLTFAGVEVLSGSPLNTPGELTDITAQIAENKRIIQEKELFIDTYKYTTREEILKLEQQEVKEILQDIYKEIKSFARKRNIAAVVRKDEVLYGEAPVNATKDFINRLKKSKKFRKRGK